ncbi:hypothetical protein [Staphylococcus saprophyticus]|uniref:hypothetical protein n=1 Tax=Staphylococcus saprophyticus TaxID=29385 RepID=UPI0034C5B327
MSSIIDLELLKYEHIYLSTEDISDYTEIIRNIECNSSFSSNINTVLQALFCNHDKFNVGMFCTLMVEIKNANIQDNVYRYIENLYNFEDIAQRAYNIVDFPMQDSDVEWKIYNGLPPQVFRFFRHIVKDPSQMNEFDILAILGIIQDVDISPTITKFINNIIELSELKSENDLNRFLNNESLYTDSLFKKYIHPNN